MDLINNISYEEEYTNKINESKYIQRGGEMNKNESNKNESKLLGQSRYRQKIAQAIFSALVNFKDKYENPLIGDN